MHTYYPRRNNAMHAVNDWCKVRAIIRALNNGKKLPPVYMDGQLGSGNWLSGTHRVSASEIRALIDPALEPYEDLELINIADYLSAPTLIAVLNLHAEDAETACDLLDRCHMDEDLIRAEIEMMIN